MAIFSDVRATERPRFRFFFQLSALLGAAQVVGVAGSESLFLAGLGVRWLPHTLVAASVVTVGFSWLYASVVSRTRNDRLFELMLSISAVVLLAATAVAFLDVFWLLPALVCLYWANHAVFLNHYWTFAGDYFDTLASKRLFPLFTVGASLGSIVGGGVAAAVGRFAPPELLIGVWALCLLAGAGLLRAHRRDLGRWGPLALEESDDTSLQGIRGALSLVRNRPLGRRLVLSSLAMVLSLFVLQYLYSDVFARSFPTASELAVFFGVYLLVTNLVEVVIELWGTPFLIRRFGVASANLVHPVLTLLAFAALAFDYRLHAALLARIDRELLENAMAGPVRNLVYNALPASVRGPTRAFLEGIVVYSGMAVAGGMLLLLAGRLDPLWLCAAGAGTALLYLAANLGVRSQYLRTLVAELREGRLDLESLSGELGRWELARLADLWQGMLAARDDRAASFASQLAPQLAARGAFEALRAGLDHDDPVVRRACVSALGEVAAPGSADLLLLALDDEDPRVRLSAASALPEADGHRQESALRRRLSDPEPRVRAAAALRLGEAGRSTLAGMLGEDHLSTVRAALAVLPKEIGEHALALVEHAEPGIQSAALDAAVRALGTVPLLPERLLELAGHASPGVRRAAVQALATRSEREVPALLAGLLADPAANVRGAAARALAERDEAGVVAAEPWLRSDTTRGVRAAIEALGASPTLTSEQLLARELAWRTRQAWRALLCLRALGEGEDDVASRFLRLAMADSLVRDWGLSLFVLRHSEGAAVMRSVEKALRFASARSRGSALEVLSNLGDRETARLLVLLAEPGPLEEKLGSLRQRMEVPDDAEGAVELARQSQNRWIRMSFELAGAPPERHAAMEDDMEKLLALKQVPLFSHFSLEQLEAVLRVTRDTTWLPGKAILREGDVGGDLYVVISGRVNVFKNRGTPEEIHLGTLGRGSYFGEMAIFDEQPRSATVEADGETRILVLPGDRLKELILQTPEMSFEILEVLTMRVREVERRLDRAVREGRAH